MASKPRNSAVFANWHASCNVAVIGGSPASHTQREMKMSVYSNYSQRIIAGFSALAITVLLFANTLATQAAEVQSVAGILV